MRDGCRFLLCLHGIVRRCERCNLAGVFRLLLQAQVRCATWCFSPLLRLRPSGAIAVPEVGKGLACLVGAGLGVGVALKLSDVQPGVAFALTAPVTGSRDYDLYVKGSKCLALKLTRAAFDDQNAAL